jgi:hypothetical protein
MPSQSPIRNHLFRGVLKRPNDNGGAPGAAAISSPAKIAQQSGDRAC